jgi:hypothetical protein
MNRHHVLFYYLNVTFAENPYPPQSNAGRLFRILL